MDLQELTLQALYRYRGDIGWLNSVELSDSVPTAQIDKLNSTVEIGTDFYARFILSCEDLAFILAHEAGHNSVGLILASRLDLNIRYSLLLNNGWTRNYLEDFFINLSLFHSIQSNILERYYATSKDWKTRFLQRRLKLILELPDQLKLAEDQQAKLDLYIAACVEWYQSNLEDDLYKAVQLGFDFFLTFKNPPQDYPGEKPMVGHKEDVTLTAGESEDPPAVSGPGSDNLKILLRIPYVLKLPIKRKAGVENLAQTLDRFGSILAMLLAKIADEHGYKRKPGWSDPSDEELLSWETENFIPWSEPNVKQDKPQIKLVFDISGSMFQYLALLNWLREQFMDYDIEFFAFSSMLSQIQFKSTHAEAWTGMSTLLDPVLEVLQSFEDAAVIIVSDGDWKLQKRMLPEKLQAIFERNRVILLQPIDFKVPYLPSSVQVQRI